MNCLSTIALLPLNNKMFLLYLNIGQKKDPYNFVRVFEEGGDILSHQWQYHLR